MENNNENEISHQQSLVSDSFSTIERLETEMAQITREFENLDDQENAEENSKNEEADDSV